MPSPISLETERLRLRPVAIDDLDEVARLHEDPEVARFMGTPDREWLGLSPLREDELLGVPVVVYST